MVLHGTDDVVTSMKASLDFFANVGTPPKNKLYVKIPGMYHEIYNEPGRDELLEAIAAFVSSRGTEFQALEGEVTDRVIDIRLKSDTAAST